MVIEHASALQVAEHVCARCGHLKPANEFHRKKASKHGLQNYCIPCNLQANREHYNALKIEVYTAYGGRCQCPFCDVTEFQFLTIDHINGDGAASRRNGEGVGAVLLLSLKRLGFPRDRHRLLCFNCNCARRLGQCPHEINHIASMRLAEEQFPLLNKEFPHGCNSYC